MTTNYTLGGVHDGNVSWTGVNTSSTNMSSTSWSSTSLNETDVKPFETALIAVIVAVVVLVIGLLFALALYIDCRHQKIEASTVGTKKRTSPRKSRIPVFLANSSANNDHLAFANKMCQSSSTNVPSENDLC